MTYTPPPNYSSYGPVGGYQQPFYQRNPGEGLGIAGFVLSLLFWPLGLILSLVSRSRSLAAGMAMTGLAKAGLIISAVWGGLMVLGVLFALLGLWSFDTSWTTSVPEVIPPGG